jgi:heme-degrading monooxygenase HmoA
MRRLFLPLVSAIGLSACSVSTPFEGPGEAVATGQTVYVGLTYAVLQSGQEPRSLFFDYVEQVEESLPRNPGFLGFSKRVKLFGNEAWTMTVWNSEESLDAFVRSETHLRAIRNAFGALESSRFARVEVSAEAAPLSWSEALRVLESEGRSY